MGKGAPRMRQTEIDQDTRRRQGRTSKVQKASRLRTLDGVIMLDPSGRPAAGSFPGNVWIVMGTDEDSIEDFFGSCDDVLTAAMGGTDAGVGGSYCVSFDSEAQDIVMNGGGSYPVYVSGLLRANRGGLE